MLNRSATTTPRLKTQLLLGLLISSLLLTSPPSGARHQASERGGSQSSRDESQPSAPVDLNQAVVKKSGKRSNAVARFDVNASRDRVWGVLTDFPGYPRVFKRLQSCRVVKQDGDLVYIESELKPHVFVRVARNRTVNDLKGRPNILDWELIDGNFRAVHGRWVLSPATEGGKCHVTYTLEVDPGPVIPPFLISFVLGFVQREIVSSLKEVAEGPKSSRPQTTSRQAAGGSG